jgi:hypothetical protein
MHCTNWQLNDGAHLHRTQVLVEERRSQDQNLTSANDSFDRIVSKTGSAWKSGHNFETRCQAPVAGLPVIGAAGLEGSLGCGELPRGVGVSFVRELLSRLLFQAHVCDEPYQVSVSRGVNGAR